MSNEDVIKEGYLRRLKTQKKRYFVLRLPSQAAKARLEYYESEKKFRSKGPPKREIYIASCLNIAKKEDWRSTLVFALYTREDVFGLIADSECELNSWLACLRTAQSKDKALRQRVSTWHVSVKPRGLGTSKCLAGQYDLQLSGHNLTLVKVDTKETVTTFKLVNIRRCGYTDCFFFMELGRSAVTGAGEMWMQVDDQIIAQNMHEAICGKMQRITSSGAKKPSHHRRCVSEGKKSMERMRQMPGDHSNTIPGSPRTRTGSSGSTRPISFKSPRTKWLHNLLPRRKSKDASVECPVDISNICQDGQATDFCSNKGVIRQSPERTSPAAREESRPGEYVNVSLEDYMNMDEAAGSKRRISDCYMDTVRDLQARDRAAMALLCSDSGYIKVTPPVDERERNVSAREQFITAKRQVPSARSDIVQKKNSPSPRQLKTGESVLPSKPNIREFVNVKKSPTTSRRKSSQDYVPMNSVGLSESDPHSYENFFPGANLSGRDVASESRYYVNFSPGTNLCDGRKFSSESNINPRELFQSKPPSDEELHSYVNFSPGKSVDEEAATSQFRKHSLESVLIEKAREYFNLNTGVVSKSKSAADLVEYVNFAPAKSFNDYPLSNGCATSETEVREYVNFSPGITPYETWRKSPRAFRRESEPARLQPFKYPGMVLDSTGEDEERPELNYIMVDLKQSDSPSCQRRRPPNIDLTSCQPSAAGPKSAPPGSPYTEIDFTKSHGLMQARLETRAAKT